MLIAGRGFVYLVRKVDLQFGKASELHFFLCVASEKPSFFYSDWFMYINSAFRFSLAPVAAALALLSSGSARAQVLAGAPAATLGTVTVEGAKPGSFGSNTVQIGTFRDQTPLDTPATHSVVTREVLDAQGQRTLYGALRNTAGVTRTQLGGAVYDNIAIRGILVENRGNYRLNGSLPVINLIDIPLENKERVEVLKGASTLYYGFVPPSGIVNFVTKRAGDVPVTSIASAINQYGGADLHLDVGRRFGTDNAWGVRLNAAAGKEALGINNFQGDRQLLAVALDYKVLPALGFKLDLEHYKKQATEQPGIQLIAAATTLPAVPNNKTNLTGDWQQTKARATNVLMRVDYAFSNNWTGLVEVGQAHVTRDRKFSQFNLTNAITGAGTLALTFQPGQQYDNSNIRAEVAGLVKTGSVSHDLTFGYTRNTRDQDSRSAVNVGITGQNLFNPVVVAPVGQTVANTPLTSRITDKGVYVFDRVTLSDKFQVLAGVRQTNYVSENIFPTPSVYTAKQASPNAALLYKLTPSTSLFASYARGLEAGNIVPNGGATNYANGGQLLPAASNKQLEAGVKAELAQGLLVQAAYFDIRRAIATVNPGNILSLDGEARYKGFELAASGEISRHWAVVASATVMEPKIIKDTVVTNTGNVPGNASKTTFSVFGEYKPDSLPGLAVNAGVYFTGERPLNSANRVNLPGYATVSLGARYKTRLFGNNASLQANVDNLTDKSYYSAGDTTGTLASVGLPRTIRVAVKFDF